MPDQMCFDCKGLSSFAFGSHWGDGEWRCVSCSEKRQAGIAHERAESDARATCEDCGIKTGGNSVCSECCAHDDFDHGICLDCSKDFSEDMAAAAYDRAKDARKYG